MEPLLVMLVLLVVDLAAIHAGADSRPSFYDRPARSMKAIICPASCRHEANKEQLRCPITRSATG